MRLQHHGTAERAFAMPLPAEPTVFTEAEIRAALGDRIAHYRTADDIIKKIVNLNREHAKHGAMFGTVNGQPQQGVIGTAGFNRQVCALLRQLGLTPVADQA